MAPISVPLSRPNERYRDAPQYLNTAVWGNDSLIRAATLQLARSMNSSTRLFVARRAFCITPIDSPCFSLALIEPPVSDDTTRGSDDSGDSRLIRTSGEARSSAPAAIRFALSLRARALSRRIERVSGSVRLLPTRIPV